MSRIYKTIILGGGPSGLLAAHQIKSPNNILIISDELPLQRFKNNLGAFNINSTLPCREDDLLGKVGLAILKLFSDRVIKTPNGFAIFNTLKINEQFAKTVISALQRFLNVATLPFYQGFVQNIEYDGKHVLVKTDNQIFTAENLILTGQGPFIYNTTNCITKSPQIQHTHNLTASFINSLQPTQQDGIVIYGRGLSAFGVSLTLASLGHKVTILSPLDSIKEQKTFLNNECLTDLNKAYVKLSTWEEKRTFMSQYIQAGLLPAHIKALDEYIQAGNITVKYNVEHCEINRENNKLCVYTRSQGSREEVKISASHFFYNDKLTWSLPTIEEAKSLVHDRFNPVLDFFAKYQLYGDNTKPDSALFPNLNSNNFQIPQYPIYCTGGLTNFHQINGGHTSSFNDTIRRIVESL